MAEYKVVGWLVSPIIQIMVCKTRSYIGGQYNWQKDMQHDLQKLESTLIQLQTVVAAAERWQTKDGSQAALLRQLKDIVYEADDLLDEFEYQIMQARAKKTRGMVSHATSSSVKLAKRLVGRDKLHAKLTEILENLDNVNKSADRLIQVAALERNTIVEQVEINNSRVTGSILPETEIFGRGKENDEIVGLLLTTVDEPEPSYADISVVTIVGVGGVGKTTLAQLVYNDQRIKNQFHLRLWICVSDNIDEIRITREMLECVSESDEKYDGLINFHMLQNKLQAKMKSKRFLLVLDDVWTDEKRGKSQNVEVWKKLFAPLKDGARDSKILVTTRIEKVAEIFGSRSLIYLKGLTDDESWSLLKRCAFGYQNPDNYPDLQEIGMRIAKRTKGSPLVIKVVGAMLKERLNAKRWLEILEREMFDDVMSTLRVSYQRLPDHLKHCFAYCSIFPKDWRFEPEKLVLFWIAQGYVQPFIRDERPILDIGMDYFNELLSRSFFQKVDQDSDTHYVIHDLIHELAQFVSLDECLRLDGGKQRAIMQSIRHLGVAINFEDELGDFATQLEGTSNLKNLRTLIFFRNWWAQCRDLPLHVFKELRSLRVLDFGGLRTDNFPKALGGLTHLRYLNVGVNFFEMLPESLCELYHLQVLATSRRLRLSKSMLRLTKFSKLKHYDVPELEFHVQKRRDHRIPVLKDMNVVLRGKLCIENLENARKEEAAKVELRRKQSIDGLHLGWGYSEKTGSNDMDVGVCEGLQPHRDLKLLEIRGYRGVKSPSWLETNYLVNIKVIHLSNFWCLDVLPPLGHLPLLNELEMGGMHALERVGGEFYGVDDDDRVKGFPSLEVLKFEDMPKWLEWCGVGFLVFPRLRVLRVRRSPKLMSFPLLPPTLTEIEIHDTRLISGLSLRRLASSLSSQLFDLESTVIPSKALLHDHLLVSIEHLLIRHCIEPMPTRGLLDLACLKQLEISHYLELASEIPEEGEEEEDGHGVLASSLELLWINECRVTDKWLARCLHGLSLLTKLHIENCTTPLESLPSAQVLHCLTTLQTLEVEYCRALTSLGGVHALASLQALRVRNCPMLESLPEEGLPASLEEVSFFHCGDAKESLLRCLQWLSSLSTLTIDFWTNLTCLPSLRHLTVFYCRSNADLEVQLPRSLESFGIAGSVVSDTLLSTCLQGLTLLSSLKLSDCTELTSLPSAQVLHSLTAVQILKIEVCRDLKSFGGVHALDSLKHFEVAGCPKLNSLPEEGLPALIEQFFLWGCDPTLRRQIQEKNGPEWDKVSHIPRITID